MRLPWKAGSPCPSCGAPQPQDAPPKGLHTTLMVICASCEAVFLANWETGLLKTIPLKTLIL